MSRYRPANGLTRCAICRQVVEGDHRHRLWARVLWVWDQGAPGRFVVYLFAAAALVTATAVIAVARAVLGV